MTCYGLFCKRLGLGHVDWSTVNKALIFIAKSLTPHAQATHLLPAWRLHAAAPTSQADATSCCASTNQYTHWTITKRHRCFFEAALSSRCCLCKDRFELQRWCPTWDGCLTNKRRRLCITQHTHNAYTYKHTHNTLHHCCVSTPLELAIMPCLLPSYSVATRRARAKALNVHSTMWWLFLPASCRMCRVVPEVLEKDCVRMCVCARMSVCVRVCVCV